MESELSVTPLQERRVDRGNGLLYHVVLVGVQSVTRYIDCQIMTLKKQLMMSLRDNDEDNGNGNTKPVYFCHVAIIAQLHVL